MTDQQHKPQLSETPAYWADIAMRGYEALPVAREVGHHAYPAIIPAVVNLAALDDQSGGLPWELDVLISNNAGMMLETHRPLAGAWLGAGEGADHHWEASQSDRDILLESMPKHRTLLKEMAGGDPGYALSCWEDEGGELLIMRFHGQSLAVRPGREGQPTQVIIPEEAVEDFKDCIADTMVMARFDPDEVHQRPLLPCRQTHAWLGVTDELTDVSRATRMSLPAGEREFYMETLDRLERFDGDLSQLAREDITRFNALRHQYLMPEAMLGPVTTHEFHDESYELSAMMCLAGAIHRNLDREAQMLDQQPDNASLRRRTTLHVEKALACDEKRAQQFAASSVDPMGIENNRLEHNMTLRGQLKAQLLEPRDHPDLATTPIHTYRVSQAPMRPSVMAGPRRYGEYPLKTM